MKHFLIYISIFCCTISLASAQAGEPREQKIQALYVAYITQQINLTEDEAQRFWPIHAQYDSEIKAANSNQNELERQQTSLNIKKKYQDRFIKVIGVDRTNNFYKTDAGFREKMIEKLRKMRQQNNNGKPRGMLKNKNNMDY